MSSKRASVSSKIYFHSSTISKSSQLKSSKPTKNLRKVLPSKKLPSTSSLDGKSCSTGVIAQNKPEKHKKVTKSDLTIKKPTKNITIDFCKNCGDSLSNGEGKHDKESDVEESNPRKQHQKTIPNSVQQHYINENFLPSTQSMEETLHGVKRVSLATIKEVSHESLLKILETEDDFDDSKDNLEDIKEFRQKNYFECHSANSRLKTKVSATNLQDHKCVYRFYLNDRLFPVPLCTDYSKEIRCIECLLPMNRQIGSEDKMNGTIQAKVTLGKKTQDVMILLPIKEPLIIHEKRKERESNDETLYFGLINLDKTGHSIFKPTLPGNSFALKYQKGFQEFVDKGDYCYNDIEKDDVIVI